MFNFGDDDNSRQKDEALIILCFNGAKFMGKHLHFTQHFVFFFSQVPLRSLFNDLKRQQYDERDMSCGSEKNQLMRHLICIYDFLQ